ncbi:hypothetical protein D3C76_1853490 [compost metagenome]
MNARRNEVAGTGGAFSRISKHPKISVIEVGDDLRKIRAGLFFRTVNRIWRCRVEREDVSCTDGVVPH